MDEENKFEKLKQIKLSKLLFKSKLKPNFNSYNIKTDRSNMKSRNKLLFVNNKNIFLNTLNTTYLYKRNIPKFNLKYKSANRKINLPGLNKIKTPKNLSKNKHTFNNQGYNYYFNDKTNNIYQKMNELLLDKKISKIKHKSLQKNNYKYNNTFIKTKKIKDNRYKSANNNNLFNRLIKKEKIESRNKYNTILNLNYKKLDKCETKFDSVIVRTMKLLFEYQKSFGILKEESKKRSPTNQLDKLM